MWHPQSSPFHRGWKQAGGPDGFFQQNGWWSTPTFVGDKIYVSRIGTEVQQWIADSNIPYEPVDQDVTIGGLPTVRFSFPGSPQAYANDEYYVIYGDQLLRITILHTEPVQDWYLYDQFLNSIAFAPI